MAAGREEPARTEEGSLKEQEKQQELRLAKKAGVGRNDPFPGPCEAAGWGGGGVSVPTCREPRWKGILPGSRDKRHRGGYDLNPNSLPLHPAM